jgi:orotidine-5'-phosphate decarboxylase
MTELYVALDFSEIDEAKSMAADLAPHVDGFKVGLELLLGEGPSAITTIVELGRPVFADAKLHDIPNTVERAARQLGKTGARYVSVHAAGGRSMVEAALAGFGQGVLAVTVLTSLDDDGEVESLAELATKAGAEGIVCSVKDLAAVKRAAPGLLCVTPGIRSQGLADDQKRVATALDARDAGADIIVVGRPITRATDPVAAAQSLFSHSDS